MHRFLHRATPTKTQTGREQNTGFLLAGGLFPDKKLSAQGTIERRKGPLPSSPADFLCAFVAPGNEYRWVVELEMYDKHSSSQGGTETQENLSKPGFYSITIKPADDTQAIFESLKFDSQMNPREI